MKKPSLPQWRLLFFAALSFLFCGCSGRDNCQLRMLVGTYTENSGSEGIYLFHFNQDDGTYEMLDTAKAGNPSFVIPDPDNCRAYSVSEYNDGRQAAVSYSMGEDFIDMIDSHSVDGEYSGADPCNILNLGGALVTSNYTGGSLSEITFSPDGTLTGLSQQYSPERLNENDQPHMHCAVLSPDGRYVFATDLGMDAVYRFIVKDRIVMDEVSVAWQFDRSTHPGPRHLVFSEDGRFVYLLHELGDLISVFSYKDGRLELLSTQQAYDSEGHGSADVHITPDGRFLYTSHRLKGDGISIFRRDENSGLVERVGFQPTGRHPRNFTITPNGKFLLCACRNSNRIEIYTIDSQTGMLSETGNSIELPAPVCIQLFK